MDGLLVPSRVVEGPSEQEICLGVVRVEHQARLRVGNRLFVLPTPELRHPHGDPGGCVRLIQTDGFLGELECPLLRLLWPFRPSVYIILIVGEGQEGISGGIFRRERDRPFEHRLRFQIGLPGVTPPGFAPAQEEVIGFQIFDRLANEAPLLVRGQLHRQRGDDLPRDFVLQGEDVRQVAIVTIGPKMSAGCRIDELRGYPYPVAGPADAALDDIVHSQLRPDLLDLHRSALVGEGGVARDDEQL